jgi:hypothetical protein
MLDGLVRAHPLSRTAVCPVRNGIPLLPPAHQGASHVGIGVLGRKMRLTAPYFPPENAVVPIMVAELEARTFVMNFPAFQTGSAIPGLAKVLSNSADR